MLKSAISRLIPPAIHPRTLTYKRILNRAAGKVIAGPFKGMTHITSPDDFVEAAMLMGTYEKELQPIIESWLARPGDLFIDVGAAQGYYSVGLARRAPNARHIAFEMHQQRIDQLERTARANGVKVDLWGACDPKRFVEALGQGGSPHVIMDVEGYEEELLKGEVLPHLRNAKMIIETHDYYVPGITAEIRGRLEPTHDVVLLEMGKRSGADLPFWITDRWSVGHLDEGRDGQTWLIANPRAAA